MDKQVQEKRAKAKENKRIQTLGKTFEFVNGENWQLIRSKLIDKIIHFDSISELENAQCDRQTIMARKEAVKMVFDWIGEIEGEARQYALEMSLTKDKKKESIILNLDDDQE